MANNQFSEMYNFKDIQEHGTKFTSSSEEKSADAPSGYRLFTERSLTSGSYQAKPHPGGIAESTAALLAKTRVARCDVLHRSLDKAEELVMRMLDSAQEGDVIELANSGFSLQHALNDLWEVREQCAPNLRDLVSTLMIMLAKVDFELLTIEQCQAIKTIIFEHLKIDSVDGKDIEESLKILRTAGFDPWKGLSVK